jgi:hypothetical protein
VTKRPIYFGQPIPENKAAVEKIAEDLTEEIMAAPCNSIITIVVKIDPHGRVGKDTTMDTRKFPLRDLEAEA